MFEKSQAYKVLTFKFTPRKRKSGKQIYIYMERVRGVQHKPVFNIQYMAIIASSAHRELFVKEGKSESCTLMSTKRLRMRRLPELKESARA